MNIFRKIYILVLAVLAGISFATAQSAVPGTFENAAPAGLEKILQADKKVNPSENELVVYYLRDDASYENWALWIWAIPGGDGNSMWKYSQDWSVTDGVAYMRFALDGSSSGGIKPVSSDGTVGLIVRQDGGWTKDGSDDRIWNIEKSNKVAIISGDQNTYAAEEYKPSFVSAELLSQDSISLTLSGKYALSLDGSDSGFTVKNRSGKVYDVLSVTNADSADKNDNFTSRILIKLNEKVSVSDSLAVSNAAFRGTVAVDSRKLSVKLAESMIPGADVELGAAYSNGKVRFNLWAPTSSNVRVNIYKKGDASKADYTVPMTFDSSTGVWTAEFSRVNPDGMFYDYTLQNSKGLVTVLDPYAKSMAAYKNLGGCGRAAIVDLNSPKAFPEGGMDAPYYNLAKREDAVIYEVSVRDFTIGNDSSVKAVPGTYKAFIEKIPYLKELGITHVQLLPVLNFYNNDETDKSYDNRGVVNGSNYNWGYDPHNYFTPEGWYASDASDPYARVRELRELINEIHKAGMGVLLDVVYNHMGNAALLDDIVPGYYFRMNENGGFKSNSGCGNDTATERAMMKRIVTDSTEHWVKNYRADGFRFDLMGLMEASSVEDSYKACAAVNPSVLFEGEGWKMYNGERGTVGMDQNYMKKTDNVAVFNDEFRDLVKAGGFNERGLGFITGKSVNTARLFSNICGVPTANYRTDDPGDNLQYLVCHDGLTLHDAVVNNVHLAEPQNTAEVISRIKLGNALVLTSQGIAFLHAGQERGRTKPNVNKARAESINNFVRNSYDSSDNINQIVWTLDEQYENLLEYTKGLVALRKNTEAFRLGDADLVQKSVKFINTGDEESQVLAYSVKADKKTYIVAFNCSTKKVTVKTKMNLKNAEVLADANTAGTTAISIPEGVVIKGKNVVLEPLTATVICVQ